MSNLTNADIKHNVLSGVQSSAELDIPMNAWAKRVVGLITNEFAGKALNGCISAYRDDDSKSIDFVVWADNRADFYSINIAIGATNDYVFHDTDPCAPTAFDALDMISLITEPLGLRCEVVRQYH